MFDVEEFVNMARYGELEEMREYLSSFTPTDISQRNSAGNNALHMASANNHHAVMLWLFDLLNLEARDVPVVLPSSHWVNAQNDNGNTPLHWAVMSGSLETVEMLLRIGADSEVQNTIGDDVVQCAERLGKDDALQLVISYRVKGETNPVLDMNGNEIEVDEEHIVRMEDGVLTLDGKQISQHELER